MSVYSCDRCKGSGRVILAGSSLDGEILTKAIDAECLECEGKGWIAVPDVSDIVLPFPNEQQYHRR